MFQGRKMIFIFVMLIVAAPLFAAGKVVTLPEIVQKTINQHPAIAERRAFLETAQAKIREQKGYLYPTLDMNLGGGREWSRNASTIPIKERGFRSLDRGESSISLNQLLFDGFQSTERVKAALGREENAQYQLLDTSESIGLRAVEVYLDILRYQALLDAAKETLQKHQTILSSIRQREKVGFDTGADLYQAMTRSILAETRLVAQEGGLAKAISSYRETVGEVPITTDMRLPFFDTKWLPNVLERVISLAEENSPAIQAAQAEVKSRKHELEVATGVFFPQINFDLKRSRNQNLDGTKGPNDDVVAMLQLRYNLFRGGADSARKREAVSEYQRAISSLAETKRKLRESIRLSYDAIKTAKQQLEKEKRHLEESSKLVEAYKAQLQIGTRTLLALLDAEDERFAAAAGLKNQSYLLLFSQYELLAKMGKLINTLQVKVAP